MTHFDFTRRLLWLGARFGFVPTLVRRETPPPPAPRIRAPEFWYLHGR